ncbi:Cyclic nucleotide-binding protein OS=Streptomyces griseorubiginosus OX=67304 GN=AQJ54_13200 PE=4 SV=1 [Streptomyces griseorubiginosus]
MLQADKFGAGISLPLEATALHAKDEDHYVVAFADGSEIAARAVVLAMGARYRRLRVPGIERLEGTSVHYSATVHEAQQCRTDPVAVVGGGNSAGQAVLFLARYAPKVYLLVREPTSEPACPATSSTRSSAIRGWRSCCTPRSPRSSARRSWRSSTWSTTARACTAASSRGACSSSPAPNRTPNGSPAPSPSTPAASSSPAREAQEACAHPEMWHGRGRSCMTLEAGLPGVFAVGDVRSGSVKRVASAAGEGAMAIHSVHRHLGHAAVPGNPGTPTVTGRSDVSPRLRHRESAWLG